MQTRSKKPGPETAAKAAVGDHCYIVSQTSRYYCGTDHENYLFFKPNITKRTPAIIDINAFVKFTYPKANLNRTCFRGLFRAETVGFERRNIKMRRGIAHSQGLFQNRKMDNRSLENERKVSLTVNLRLATGGVGPSGFRVRVSNFGLSMN